MVAGRQMDWLLFILTIVYNISIGLMASLMELSISNPLFQPLHIHYKSGPEMELIKEACSGPEKRIRLFQPFS
ncbi:hypothetical protein [Oceanispirochaeta sp.]|uniref:hypothetical protein n=1 Tax=Oceanispirochaeta sp. TaxID=2035350 RepID=UPI00260A18EB|nr:hypothetical protein [Oceanispirochaeta sp.]MDA3958135.1 hypothetical protein [Oceanispirochaeta sp.]